MTPELEERLRDLAARAADGWNGGTDRLEGQRGLGMSNYQKKHRKAQDEQELG